MASVLAILLGLAVIAAALFAFVTLARARALAHQRRRQRRAQRRGPGHYEQTSGKRYRWVRDDPPP